MLNPLRNEVALVLGSRYYILRPTLDALRRIEYMAGIPIPRLAFLCAEGDIPIATARYIIQEGIRAAGGTLPQGLWDHLVWSERYRTTAMVFLLKGLGCITHDNSELELLEAVETQSSGRKRELQDVIPWDQLAHFALSGLHLSPQAFWQMTLPELLLMCQRYHTPYLHAAPPTMTVEQLQEIKSLLMDAMAHESTTSAAVAERHSKRI